MKARTCAKDLRDSSKAVLSKLRLSASASLRIEKIHWQSGLISLVVSSSTYFPKANWIIPMIWMSSSSLPHLLMPNFTRFRESLNLYSSKAKCDIETISSRENSKRTIFPQAFATFAREFRSDKLTDSSVNKYQAVWVCMKP